MYSLKDIQAVKMHWQEVVAVHQLVILCLIVVLLKLIIKWTDEKGVYTNTSTQKITGVSSLFDIESEELIAELIAMTPHPFVF